jgi:hypothetical protein
VQDGQGKLGEELGHVQLRIRDVHELISTHLGKKAAARRGVPFSGYIAITENDDGVPAVELEVGNKARRVRGLVMEKIHQSIPILGISMP